MRADAYSRGVDAVPAAAAWGGTAVGNVHGSTYGNGQNGGVVAVPVASSTMLEKCIGLKGNGERCTAPPAKATELCIGHLRKAGRWSPTAKDDEDAEA